MNGKPYFTAVLLSSMLTTALILSIFAWSGSVEAKQESGRAGYVQVDSLQNRALEDNTAATLVPAVVDDTTGDGYVGLLEQFSGAAPATSLTEEAKMSHWFILGSHLLPRSSTIEYSYTGNGCIFITSSAVDTRMQFPVTLPDRSIIKSMDVFYVDSTASDLVVWLTRYNPYQTNFDIVSVASSGNAGYGSKSSVEVTDIVDNSSWAYSLNYSWEGVTNSTLQICGIRINYIDPFYSTFLPITVTP